MTVYIVIFTKSAMIESVWSSKELANAACWYHAMHRAINIGIEEVDVKLYSIIERKVNTAHQL